MLCVQVHAQMNVYMCALEKGPVGQDLVPCNFISIIKKYLYTDLKIVAQTNKLSLLGTSTFGHPWQRNC